MATTCKTSLDWMLFLDGYTASKTGKPFEIGQTPQWQEGYRLQLREHTSPCFQTGRISTGVE